MKAKWLMLLILLCVGVKNYAQTPSVTISANPGNTVCYNQTVTFTASVTNPNNAYTITNYQWKRSGYNIGTNSPSLTLLAGIDFFNGNNVSCVVTYTGAANGVVTSNILTMYVNQSQNVSISLGTGSNYICQGNTVTCQPSFSSYTGNQNYTYSWYNNGTLVSTNSTYVSNALVTGDVIELTTNSLNNTCQNPNPFSAPPMTINVINPSISISTNSTTACNSVATTFTATASATGPNPQFNWKVNGTTIAITTVPNYTFLPFSLNNNAIVTCELITAGCTIVSNSITMTVIPGETGSVNIGVSQYDQCSTANNTATFTANPYYGNSVNPTLQWKKNGVAIAGATSTTYNATGLVNGDVFVCEMITNNVCRPIIPSNAITMNIVGTNSLAVPTISINYGNNFHYICSGNPWSFNIAVTSFTFAGTNPSYQWKKNGINIGTNSPYLSLPNNTFANGDVITCELTSSLACAISSPVISNSVIVSVRTAPFATYTCTTKEVCTGDIVNYEILDYDHCECDAFSWGVTWQTSLLGSSPIHNQSYTYQLNQLNPFDSTFFIWEFYNRVVWVDAEFYPDEFECPNSTQTTIDGLYVGTPPTFYYSNFTPTINITSTLLGNPCSSNTYLFTANPTGGGANATYQWKKNGVNIPDATFKQVAFNNLNNGDIITCEMTSSLSCASPAMVSSNAITITPPQVTVSLAASSICAGGTVNVNLTGGNAGATYTWQVSTNSGTTWANITGYVNTTNTSFSNIPGSSRSYRVIVNDPICGVYTTSSVALTLVADPVLTVTPSNNNFCAGGNTILSTAVTGGLGTNSYQWQQYIGTTWTNIAGATGASYTASNVSATTNYRANLTQSVSGCAASVISPITVNALPNITTNPTSANIVNGNSISLNAYNGTSYSWSPATGLNTTTGATVIASPSASITYTVTGTDANGCSKAISLPITVSYSTDIAENTITDVSIFPNPADKNISISMNTPFSQAISFCISDMLGKTLTQWEGKAENGVYENEISIENLSQGVYFLSVKIGERVMTQKFVKE